MTNFRIGDIVALTEALSGYIDDESITEPKGTVAKVMAVSQKGDFVEIETTSGVPYRVFVDTVMETTLSDEKFDKLRRHVLN